MKSYFITGTDTGIGKTYVTLELMRALKAQGQTVLGLKPVACGVEGQGNEDALAYLKENSLSLPYEQINPYLFHEPISPHLAARHDQLDLTVKNIIEGLAPAMNQAVDYMFIEGAGGVCVPLNEEETLLDLMCALNLPVILVVGLRLGCLNHAIMSARILQAAGLTLAGWVPNPIDPDMLCQEENIQTLIHALGAPFAQSHVGVAFMRPAFKT